MALPLAYFINLISIRPYVFVICRFASTNAFIVSLSPSIDLLKCNASRRKNCRIVV